MAIDTSKADQAAAAALEAAQAARNAQDAAEVEFLDSVTRVSQITDGRTKRDADRLKSRFISAFGFDRWQRLCADSR